MNEWMCAKQTHQLRHCIFFFLCLIFRFFFFLNLIFLHLPPLDENLIMLNVGTFLYLLCIYINICKYTMQHECVFFWEEKNKRLWQHSCVGAREYSFFSFFPKIIIYLSIFFLFSNIINLYFLGILFIYERVTRKHPLIRCQRCLFEEAIKFKDLIDTSPCKQQEFKKTKKISRTHHHVKDIPRNLWQIN